MRQSIAYTLAILSASLILPLSAMAAPDTKTKPYYGKELCSYPGFNCVKVKKGQTWDKLFPNLRERELVKRLNRSNMPLYMRKWIIVPNNLQALSHLDISPFPHYREAEGHRVILIDLSLHAFAAYEKSGQLLHWGPISGGKQYCKGEPNGTCKTITGDFRITRKDNEECISGTFPKSTDGGAPMPFCMFFKGGYAMHGSTLPGFHNSHGCVRLFYDDAKWLNRHFAKIGTRVIVTE